MTNTLYTYSDGATLSYQPARSLSERRWFVDGRHGTLEAFLKPKEIRGTLVAGVIRVGDATYAVRQDVVEAARVLDAAAPLSIDDRICRLMTAAGDVTDARRALAEAIERTRTDGIAPDTSEPKQALAAAEAKFASLVAADPEAVAEWERREAERKTVTVD